MDRRNVTTKITESALQKQIYSLLTTIGYKVMETGKGRAKQKCSKCGFSSYATGWQGNTVGLPDLYIHSINWPRGQSLAVELKTQTGEIRKEQKQLADAGLVYICRSVGCVINAVIACERIFNNYDQVETLEKIKEINGF